MFSKQHLLFFSLLGGSIYDFRSLKGGSHDHVSSYAVFKVLFVCLIWK